MQASKITLYKGEVNLNHYMWIYLIMNMFGTIFVISAGVEFRKYKIGYEVMNRRNIYRMPPGLEMSTKILMASFNFIRFISIVLLTPFVFIKLIKINKGIGRILFEILSVIISLCLSSPMIFICLVIYVLIKIKKVVF
jgi:hypothetical protein